MQKSLKRHKYCKGSNAERCSHDAILAHAVKNVVVLIGNKTLLQSFINIHSLIDEVNYSSSLSQSPNSSDCSQGFFDLLIST